MSCHVSRTACYTRSLSTHTTCYNILNSSAHWIHMARKRYNSEFQIQEGSRYIAPWASSIVSWASRHLPMWAKRIGHPWTVVSWANQKPFSIMSQLLWAILSHLQSCEPSLYDNTRTNTRKHLLWHTFPDPIFGHLQPILQSCWAIGGHLGAILKHL